MCSPSAAFGGWWDKLHIVLLCEELLSVFANVLDAMVLS